MLLEREIVSLKVDVLWSKYSPLRQILVRFAETGLASVLGCVWEWLFVYLAAPPAHQWECFYLAQGLEDQSIFTGVQTIRFLLFMHHFLHLLENSSFIHCFPTLSVISNVLCSLVFCFSTTYDFWLKLGLTQGDREKMLKAENDC